MKTNKITQFLKNHVFHFAMGIVVIGALAAVLFLPNEGNVKPDANVQNEQVDGGVTDEYENEVVTVEDNIVDPIELAEEELTEDEYTNLDDATVEEANDTDEVAQVEEENVTVETEQVETTALQDEEELNSETFESTAVASLEQPFFADGDTFELPVSGDMIVHYTDETTKHWFSESLNQTMRTFGVCFAANEGEEVKAVAQGTVLDILPDSSTLADSNMPYVGSVMVVDLGNGYKVTYGFQNGTPDASLKGQVVNVGDVLGTVGAPTGAFISEGSNIYLQVTHDNEVVSPETFFEVAQIEK